MSLIACQEHPVPHHSSFRDPSGFVYKQQGEIRRQVNRVYRPHYEQLMNSGLYLALTNKNWLVSHLELDKVPLSSEVFKILRPEPVSFISYPHEWSFSQLKDAALLTLNIQKMALEYGMILKDASAYNIQFEQGSPIFIDTLSFELYEEGQPWEAYKQFCQHFLSPLALMAQKDIRLGQLLKIYLDGIPLGLVSTLLAKSSWLNPGLLVHIHLHAKMEHAFSQSNLPAKNIDKRKTRLSKNGLLGILSSLEKAILKLEWKPEGTEWATYYQETNYSDHSFSEKERIICAYLQHIQPKLVWDLGANTGHFSQLAKKMGAQTTVAFDIDPAAVEINYRQLKAHKQQAPLPLLLDLTNPTPGLGWHSKERDSLISRGPADCLLALALIHHLAISNNTPLEHIAAFFADLGNYLIIEFVPKTDSQVQRLLKTRKDIFTNYTKESFEKAFQGYFTIQSANKVDGSERMLYLMVKHNLKDES